MSQNKIRAVFFDVDGTTYQHSIHSVPDGTMDGLRQLKKSGIKIAISTSRVKGEMVHLPSSFLELFDGIICAGGALIEADGKIIQESVVDPEDAQRVIEYCRKNQVVLRWADDRFGCFYDCHTDLDHDAIFEYLYLMCPELRPWNHEKLIHLLFYVPQDQEEEIRGLLHHSNLVLLKRCMEVTGLGISKASAIKTLADYWNIPYEATMAFGDGYNDIEMLKTAGIGIAMGQAHTTIQEAADYVTAPIDEDGIAKALRHFNLII